MDDHNTHTASRVARTIPALMRRAALNPELRDRLRRHPIETLRIAGFADAQAQRLMSLAPVTGPGSRPAPARRLEPALP